MGSPDVPLLRCRETLVLMRDRIYVFGGTSMSWWVYFLKFQISHAVFHSFLINSDVHMTPENLVPRDFR